MVACSCGDLSCNYHWLGLSTKSKRRVARHIDAQDSQDSLVSLSVASLVSLLELLLYYRIPFYKPKTVGFPRYHQGLKSKCQPNIAFKPQKDVVEPFSGSVRAILLEIICNLPDLLSDMTFLPDHRPCRVQVTGRSFTSPRWSCSAEKRIASPVGLLPLMSWSPMSPMNTRTTSTCPYRDALDLCLWPNYVRNDFDVRRYKRCENDVSEVSNIATLAGACTVICASLTAIFYSLWRCWSRETV